MGAVPEECNLIVELDGVEFDTVIYGEDMVGYRFKPDTGLEIKELTQSEIDALDDVIEQFGDFNTEQIVEKCIMKMLINTLGAIVLYHLPLQRT